MIGKIVPVSSIIGACNPLVRETYPPPHQPTLFQHASAHRSSEFLTKVVELTVCIRAPLPYCPPATAIALLFPKLASDFCLFTTIWEDPKAFDAGRFSADMIAKIEP